MPSLVSLAAIGLCLPALGQLTITFTDLHPAGTSTSRALAASGSQQGGWTSGTSGSTGRHAALWQGAPDTYVDLHPDVASDSFVLAVSGVDPV